MSRPAQSLRLHHVGFVVADIQQSIAGFMASLTATWDGVVFEDPYQKVKVTFIATGPGQASIELIEPAAPDSPVLRFLQEKGGGLNHVCYEVEDLQEQLTAMRARGAIIAKKPKPAVAFGGRQIAWVITPERLLVEFLETPCPIDNAGQNEPGHTRL